MDNFLIWGLNWSILIVGILMLTGGSILLTVRQGLEDVIDVSKTPPILLIVFGVFAFCIAFLAFYDHIRKTDCFILWMCLAIIIVPIQFGVIVGGIVNEGDFQAQLPTSLSASTVKYNSVPKVEHKWDDIHMTLKCCGSHNYTDWKSIGKVPESCCKEKAPGCSDGVLDGVEKAKEKIYMKGCSPEIVNNMGKYVLVGVAVVASIELIFWIFGCSTFCLIAVATFPYHVYCPLCFKS